MQEGQGKEGEADTEGPPQGGTAEKGGTAGLRKALQHVQTF